MAAADVANGDAVPPANVSQRDLWVALEQMRNEFRGSIEALRTETREARHSQANLVTASIGELRKDGDIRMREIERVMDASNPVTIGPRINVIERWQSRMDGDLDGGAPTRISRLEDTIEQMRGTVAAFRIVAVALGAVGAALGIYAALKP